MKDLFLGSILLIEAAIVLWWTVRDLTSWYRVFPSVVACTVEAIFFSLAGGMLLVAGLWFILPDSQPPQAADYPPE